MVVVEQDVPSEDQRQDQDLAHVNGESGWRDGELELREREVSSGRASVLVQFIVATVALLTVVVALLAAKAAREAGLSWLPTGAGGGAGLELVVAGW